jgi:hypothetical protein
MGGVVERVVGGAGARRVRSVGRRRRGDGELVGVEAAMVIVKGWVGGDLEGQKIKRDIKSSKILKLVWISQRR